MNCPDFEIKDYFFGEGDLAAGEAHLRACAPCREELSRLQLTQAALGALRDEEIPRRIGFVSDKIFEPRWYQRLWNSGPQLGFLGASLLAGAILVHAFIRPAVPAMSAAPVTVSKVDPAVIEREIAGRVEAAVARAVAESETRQQQKTAELLRAADRRYELDRRATLEAIATQSALFQKMQARDYAVLNLVRSGE